MNKKQTPSTLPEDTSQSQSDSPNTETTVPSSSAGCKKRVKTGGRVKGTPNKVTSLSKSVISNMLDQYQESGLMGADFLALEPKDRMQIAERLMQYVLPRLQSTAVDLSAHDTKVTIEQKLIERSKNPNDPKD